MRVVVKVMCRPNLLAAASCLAVGALAVLPLRASQATLLADTYVTTARPSTNYGALSNLYVNATGKALLRFDATAVPAGTTSAQIGRATLRIYVNRVNVPGTLTLLPVSADWREAAVTSQTLPPLGSAVDVEAATDEGQYVVFDVTALVKKWTDDPGSDFGVALSATTADVVVDSKENDTTARPATLDVVLAPGTGATGPKGDAGPAGPQGLTGPQGPAGLQGLAGPQGPAGSQGSAGPAGIAGPQGAKGEKGDAGGLTYQGAYDAATSYNSSDLVSYAGAAWVSLVSSNRGITPGTDNTRWGLLVPAATSSGTTSGTSAGLAYRGAFSASALYGWNDVVTYAGAAWVSLSDNNRGNAPDTSSSSWAVLVPAATSSSTVSGKSLAFRGAYASTLNYAGNDVVTWQSAAWISLVDSNHGNTPDASPMFWAVLVPAAVGLPGAAGATGAAGPQGPQGERGYTGADGATGAAGPAGPAGKAGLTYRGAYSSVTNYASGDVAVWQGSSYASLTESNHGNTPDASPADWGLLTSTGPKGDKGDAGTQGLQGIPGLQGPLGPAGERGMVGPVGSTGPQGAAGRDGAPGPQGERGPFGPKGDAGPVGLTFRGAYASTRNYAANDAVTWQSQTWLSLVDSNAGQTPDLSPAYWTLLAARGGTGAQGAAGPAGPQGTRGDTGLPGATGPQGLKGDTGPQGTPGMYFQGAYSSTANYALHDAVTYGGGTWLSLSAANHGNTPGQSPNDWAQLAAPGTPGAQGIPGPAGSTGPAGTKGEKGDAGVQGMQGNAGPQGPPVTFRGNWTASAAYQTGDAVSYSGSSWIATAAIGGSPPGTVTQWSLLAQQGSAGPAGLKGDTGATGAKGETGSAGSPGAQGDPGLNWRGTYNSQTNYAARDAVFYNGSSYVSLLAGNTGNTPGLAGVTQWVLLAQAGTDGAKGDAGIAGSNGSAATIAISSVATGAPGSSVTVTNSGTPGAAQLNFSIPRGDKGDPGAAGTAGLVYQGGWNAGTGYAKNDAVYLNGTSYIALTANSNSNPANDVANNLGNWSLLAAQGAAGANGAATVTIGSVSSGNAASVTNSGSQTAARLDFVLPKGDAGPAGAPGLTWRGTWDGATPYAINDAVSYSGSAYIAIANSRSTAPTGTSNSNAAWTLLAAQGSTGATPTLSVGPTVTGAPGTQASVSLGSGNVFTFTIPRGDTGETGPAGSNGSGGSAGAVFTSVHTVTTKDQGAQFYSALTDKTAGAEVPAIVNLLPSACTVTSISLYNTGTAGLSFEFRTGTAPNTLATLFSCTVGSGASACGPTAAQAVGGRFASLRLTSNSTATSYLYAAFTCN